MKKQSIKNIIIVLAFIGILFVIYQIGNKYFSLELFKEHSLTLKSFVSKHYFISIALYLLFFILIVLIGLPVVPLFALASGYLFGITYGLIYAELGAILGAIISFLIYRAFFYRMIRDKYKVKFEKFEQKIKKDGATYLLMLQFLGVVPFFVINALAILADISLVTMIWTTALGSLPFLLVYVVAGGKLRTVTSMKDLFSWQTFALLCLFALLAALPLIIKKIKRSSHF